MIRIFKILLPTIFPIVIPAFFCSAAVILTAAGYCVDLQHSSYYILLIVAQAIVIGLTIYSWKGGDEDE